MTTCKRVTAIIISALCVTSFYVQIGLTLVSSSSCVCFCNSLIPCVCKHLVNFFLRLVTKSFFGLSPVFSAFYNHSIYGVIGLENYFVLHFNTNNFISSRGITLNSLLPVGRYINMDPSLTYLVISQTQVIRFGQLFLAKSVRINYTFLV